MRFLLILIGAFASTTVAIPLAQDSVHKSCPSLMRTASPQKDPTSTGQNEDTAVTSPGGNMPFWFDCGNGYTKSCCTGDSHPAEKVAHWQIPLIWDVDECYSCKRFFPFGGFFPFWLNFTLLLLTSNNCCSRVFYLSVFDFKEIPFVDHIELLTYYS